MAGDRAAIIWWGIPLTILAGIATHLTSRRSVARQREMNIDTSGSPQTAIMNKLMLYMFPLFVVVGGPFFPLAILFYWLANNSWTFGQLRVAHTLQDRKKARRRAGRRRGQGRIQVLHPEAGRQAQDDASGRPVIAPSKIADSNGSGGADGRHEWCDERRRSGNGGPKLTKTPPTGGAKPGRDETCWHKACTRGQAAAEQDEEEEHPTLSRVTLHRVVIARPSGAVPATTVVG